MAAYIEEAGTNFSLTALRVDLSQIRPACLTAGGASVLSESQESSNPINKEEFLSQSLARSMGRFSNFEMDRFD
ncbi:hypothetical protein J7K03_01550 [bacterium]|nr:hypothetical protein [bacterium]